MRTKAHSKSSLLARLGLGIGLAILVVGVSEGLVALDRSHRDRAIGGFLTKTTGSFLVAWRTRENLQYSALRFESLDDARRHLAKLGLVPGGVPSRQGNRIERLWVRNEGVQRVVFWKIRRVPYTHRLSFRNMRDARYFFLAFEQGHYTPSPFGHAIFFSPRQGSHRL